MQKKKKKLKYKKIVVLYLQDTLNPTCHRGDNDTAAVGTLKTTTKFYENYFKVVLRAVLYDLAYCIHIPPVIILYAHANECALLFATGIYDGRYPWDL